MNANGCKVTFLESSGCLPLEIESTESGLLGGKISLSASISSQFVSSILLSAPYASTPVFLDLTGDAVISQPYIDMTIEMMKVFGINVERLPGSNQYSIPVGVYKNPPIYYVEADASSATYPLAFAAITGRHVVVQNMGSNSLQGDSQFAVKVLRRMGCHVEQTESTTSVKGPAVLLPIPTIDMESMTDAFMTAVVLAAVSQGGENITRITGIANQRVKECDRIAAMIEQLARFGVSASELPDGILIHGIPKTSLKVPTPNGVKCYDDHRIAMSFSILASAFVAESEGVIIGEKVCVEKTWPAWWDVLDSTLGMKLTGIDCKFSDPSFYMAAPESFSIVLIGMRGAGKTMMGNLAAKYLGYEFLDMDAIFESHCKQSIPEYLLGHSWVEFRALEFLLLGKVLKSHTKRSVISCGGGIVESSDAIKLLKDYLGFVIHIRRDLCSIETYLGIDKTRPLYGDDLKATWLRRKPLYDECSTHEFFSLPHSINSLDQTSPLSVTSEIFGRFIDFISKKRHVSADPATFFISLTFKNVREVLPMLDQVTEGACAIEIRVDLLESSERDFVTEQIAHIRSSSRLPIIFTVRTKSQGGLYPDEMFGARMDLMLLAVRLGCEYVDVQFESPFERYTDLLSLKGSTLLIGSFHDCTGRFNWDPKGCGATSMKTMFDQLYHRCDVIKLIGTAIHLHNNLEVQNFMYGIDSKKPVIAMLMGNLGKMSRVLNSVLTPVTHAKIPTPAAPGQLSLREINILRSKLGMIETKSFFLAGYPISASMSPTLHKAGFDALGLPHEYVLAEMDDISKIKSALKGDVFGASVTIPLKVHLLSSNICTSVSESAMKIGAINTVIKRADGCWLGDNTDWLGIRNSVLKRFRNFNDCTGVILGAGGTARAACYALQSLGITNIRIWNRTFAKSVILANEFGCIAVEKIGDAVADNITPCRIVIVGTIPSGAQETIGDLSSLFKHSCQGMTIDMAYRPRQTKLLKISAEYGYSTVEGIEVLLEQGFEQFERWTKIPAPRRSIMDAVYSSYL